MNLVNLMNLMNFELERFEAIYCFEDLDLNIVCSYLSTNVENFEQFLYRIQTHHVFFDHPNIEK